MMWLSRGATLDRSFLSNAKLTRTAGRRAAEVLQHLVKLVQRVLQFAEFCLLCPQLSESFTLNAPGIFDADALILQVLKLG